ncbi:MAG: restriction endonuclease subunit S [Chitinophagales bacterium]|nr:restriction endonuclease subunit S [Bacteroidota bacterium]MCB9044159.1 restriction endonuclease subunit S [Chitinophagales bacterium]
MKNQANQNNQGSNNIPQLRFPEFTGEWEKKKLGEVAEISSGGTPSRTNRTYWNGEIPWVSTTLIDFNFIDKTEEYITEERLKNSSAKLLPKGTLLMAMYGQGKTRGKISILNIEASTNQACGAIITNNEVLNSLFAFQNLAKRYDEIRDLSNQGGEENFSGSIIKGIEISFPTLTEQTKIATFLTAVDEKIQALKKKYSLLEVYKKGVMQRLFCLHHDSPDLHDEYDLRDGKQEKNQGNQENHKKSRFRQLRFKDENGNDFPDWEVKKLGEVCEKQSSNISANKIEENFGNYIIYGAAGVLKKVDFYEVEEDYISIVKNGAGVGRLLFCKGKSSVLGTLDIIKPIGKINTYFLYCLLSNIDFSKYTTGSTIPHIYFKDYKNEDIILPCLEEQTLIANFLSDLDEKINVQTRLIASLEQWKKGLLQKMFV